MQLFNTQGGPKKLHIKLMATILSNLKPNFQNSSTGRFFGKFAVKWLLRIPPLSGNNLRQTVHTHCASVTKLVAALLRVAGVTAGLAESNGSLPPGL